MRILFPSRIPVTKSLLFCLALAFVELLEGTDPIYVFMVLLFFMLTTFAFNIAGGFTRPSGAYIFFYALLSGGLGTVYKALLGQAADTHLESPMLVLSVYTATVGTMLIAAFLTRRITSDPNGIAGILHVPKLDLRTSALGCMVMVFLINYSFLIFPAGAGSILHALAMVNYFLPLGILLGTIAAVRDSGGRRSTSGITLFALIYSTYYGLLSFSKQGMFTPFVCWVLGLAWAGYPLKGKHLATILGFCFLAQGFLVPLANVGRGDMLAGTPDERLAIVEHYVENPGLLRQINRERLAGLAGSNIFYYGTSQGIFDRLTMLPNDAQLMAFTAAGHYYGYMPVVYYFQNWVPHIINPHKLEGIAVGGNAYAHEMGQLADEDWTTGISYTPSAEAFHLDGWTSTLLLQPLIYLLLFVVTDAVCGDLRYQPWGLLPMLLFSHIAPEGLLSATINYVWLGNVGTIFCIFVCGYIAPVFGRLLKGRERAPLWQSTIGLPTAPAEAV